MEAIYDRDIDRGAIEGKTIAIIGYGSQGRAHALNLRDSGCKVVVGLRGDSGSRPGAQRDGVEVAEVAEAVKRADVTMMLIPDEEQPATYLRDVKDNLKPGSSLAFAHGFGIHFGTIVPPDNVDVWMCAPKGPGRMVRREYEIGRGVPCLIAIHQDHTGKAQSDCGGVCAVRSAADARASSRRTSAKRPRPICSASRPFSAAAPRRS